MEIMKLIEEAYSQGKIPALALDRVSSLKQKYGYSLEMQADAAPRYAGLHKLEIIKSFHVAESAWKSQRRKNFRAMVEMSREYKIKNLIFKNVSRFNRNYDDLALLMNLIDNEGYTIHFYERGVQIQSGSSSVDKMIIGMETAYAKQHSDKLSEDIREMNARKVSMGIAPGSSRQGYRYIKEERRYEKHNEAVNEYILRTYLRSTLSIVDFCAQMNAEKKYTDAGRPWTKTIMHKFLTNPFNAGKIVHRGRTFPGNHEGYLTEEEYDSIVSRLKSNYTTKKGRAFLLKNFIRLEGKSLTGEIKQDRWTYYSNRALKVNLREEELMDLMDGFVDSIRFSEAFAESLKRMTREIIAERDKGDKTNVTLINREINTIKKKKLKILNAFADDDIDRDTIMTLMAEFDSKMAHLERQKREAEIDTKAFYIKVVDVIDGIRKMPDLYASMEPGDKISTLKAFMTHVNITKKGLQPNWIAPFHHVYDVLEFKDLPSVPGLGLALRKCPEFRATPNNIRTDRQRADDFRTRWEYQVRAWMLAA